jgi:acetyl-CoA carboxylase carboxyltransferase component
VASAGGSGEGGAGGGDNERDDDLARLAALDAKAGEGGGADLQRRQRRLGRMLVRERVDALLDPGSFVEIGRLSRVSRHFAASAAPTDVHGDGVVAGTGTIDGRPVAVFAHDATVLRGALGVGGARKIVRVMELAAAQRMPILALHDSDGVRVNEGPEGLAGFSEVLGATARFSGWVPQIGVVLGLCVGGAAYSSALEDVVIANEEGGYLFVTGSKVTQVMTGQEATIDEIGGVPMHAQKTGLVQLRFDDEKKCIDAARRVLSYLPQCALEAPPVIPTDDPADRDTSLVLDVIPESDKRPYDVRRIVSLVMDEGSFLELQPEFARSLVVGFARIEGRPIGVVASQPMVNAGCLDIDASRKGARFIQLCSAFGLPVVTFADVPGFLPGKRQEQGGLLLHGAKLIAAYGQCRTPLVSLVVRKSYGGGNVLAWPADVRLAYPFARVQPMGADAAKAVARHRTFAAGDAPPSDADIERELEESFGEGWDKMERAAEAGFVDAVIHPKDTRRELAKILRTLTPRPDRRIPPRFHPNVPM